MTPRQLSAFERLHHWENEEFFASIATAVRVAQHSDKKGFESYIKKMTQ